MIQLAGMKYLSLFLFLFVAAAHAAPFKVISLGAGFDKFIAESANADFDTQLKSWVKNVESTLPEVYLHVLADDKPKDLDAKRRAAAANAFPFLLSHAKEIHDQFQLYENEGRAIVAKLAAQYPEANLNDVVVVAMPSLDKFNGQVITLGHTVYAMFGMDMIAHIVAKPDFRPGAVLLNDLPVVMAHEFTHVLHHVLSDFDVSDNTSASFFAPLWEEGLAQVNSQLLVPGSALELVYMEKVVAQQCTPKNIASWSKLYLQDAKGNDVEIEAAYPKWFMMKPEALTALGVYRAGYCLGYNVILGALREHSMREILKMPRAEAYQIGRDTLTEMGR